VISVKEFCGPRNTMKDIAANGWEKLMEPEGVIIISPEMKITFLNEAAQHLTGFDPWKTVSMDCRSLFSNWEKVHTYLRKTINDGRSIKAVRVDITSAEQDSITAIASFSPIRLTDQGVKGAVLVLHIPERILPLYNSLKEKTLELINERNKLDAIFNSRWEGTFTIDEDCTITMFNRSAEKITGYKVEEAIGRKCWDIFNTSYCQNGCPRGRARSASEGVYRAGFIELYITKKDSKKVPVRVTTAPLYNAEGEHIGAVESFQDITELRNLRNHLANRFRLSNIIGRSEGMEKVYGLIEDVSKSNSTVLITGESGTGKELVARAIHLNSHRRSDPFVAVNCSAFAETLLESELFGHERGAFTGAFQTKQGRFEIAQGGTLFLDEIGDISPAIQMKLLRVLETRQFERVGGTKAIKIDVRLIAATNKNLTEEVEAGRMREDFYYRINVINIHLPALRDRIDDLPLLIQNLIDKNSQRFNKSIMGITSSALKLLKAYDWPGNVRELENVMEHAFVMCHDEMIDVAHLPEKFHITHHGKEKEDVALTTEAPLKLAEKVLISSTLKKFDGHRGKTAQALGIDKSTLWRKMKKYELIK